MSFQQYVCREIVAAATSAGGHIVWLGDSTEDGLASVRAFGNWEKLRNRKTKGPHLSALAFHNVQSVRHLADMLNHEEHGSQPRLIVRDVSRSIATQVPTDLWPTWLPLLVRLAPAAYLTVCHHGIRGVSPTQNKKPYTATWVITEDQPAPPAERYGERFRITNVADGQIIRLHGHSYPSDMLFDLYEKPKEKVS
jgi:hypothetical protein